MTDGPTPHWAPGSEPATPKKGWYWSAKVAIGVGVFFIICVILSYLPLTPVQQAKQEVKQGEQTRAAMLKLSQLTVEAVNEDTSKVVRKEVSKALEAQRKAIEKSHKGEPDLSFFERCEEEDGSTQWSCVWDDGTGNIVINIQFGHSSVSIPRK